MARRILLIDDDRMQIRIAQAYFKEFLAGDFELDWAATYEDGLEKLMSGDYAACLLDYQLGPRDGLQLFREAKALGCTTPTVLLTASEDIDEEGSAAGVYAFLEKKDILKNVRALRRNLVYALKIGDLMREVREARDEAKRLAIHDQLTGLLNRREFDRILHEEMDRAKRFDQSVALVMVDLDHFKSVNDTHGHPAGDAVLRAAAQRISSEVRSVDRATRVGGEEFALILVQADRTGAMDVARRVCAAMAREEITLPDGKKIRITASLGVAVAPLDAHDETTLMAAADKALYAAKQQGRNRAIAYPEIGDAPKGAAHGKLTAKLASDILGDSGAGV